MEETYSLNIRIERRFQYHLQFFYLTNKIFKSNLLFRVLKHIFLSKALKKEEVFKNRQDFKLTLA